MVDTIKFSEFVDGGDLANSNTTVGLEGGDNARFNNPWTFLAPGTTGDRPAPDAAMYYRLRFNTTLQSYEFYDPITIAWVQVEDSGDITDLIARLAAHTLGDGASMIGLQDQSNVSLKTVQDLANATLIAQTNNGTIQNGQFIANLASGFLVGTTTTGVILSRELVPTANQIDITNVDGIAGDSGFSLSATLDLPGTFTIQGSTVLNEIIDDDTMATATDSNISTSEAIKAYVDSFGPGTVTSVSGTANEISVDNTIPADPVVSLADNPVIPGLAGVTLPSGTTAERAGAAGTIRFNSQTNLFEVTVDGAAWVTLDTHTGGDVDSIIGTANQVIASSPTGNVTLSLPQSIGTSSAVQFASLALGAFAVLPLTEWVTYTPTFTGFGTVVDIQVWSRRVGGNLEVRGKFTVGTPTAVPAEITLGFNGTNSNITSSNIVLSGINLVGQLTRNQSTVNQCTILVKANVGYFNYGIQSAGSSGITIANGNDIFSAGNIAYFYAFIPVDTWP